MPRGTRAAKQRKRIEIAKALVAGKRPPSIAKELGCSKQHVQGIEAEPETQALIQRIMAPHRERLAKVVDQAIAVVERATTSDQQQREERIGGLKERIGRLRQIIAERATDAAVAKAPGGRTGLVVHRTKGVGAGAAAQVVDEYEVDTGLLAELRDHERQLRDELNDFGTNLKAVERACDLLELADGKRNDPAGESGGQFTLVQIYQLLQLTEANSEQKHR